MRSRDLLFHSLLLLQGINTDPLASISENDRKLIEQAAQLINADLSNHLRIKELSQNLAISPPTFKRLFKAVKGMPPFEYLVMQRMKLALSLLQSGTSVKEAAALTGYQCSSFTKAFNKYYGKPPSEV
jgi:AraC-like DNA-binding protein